MIKRFHFSILATVISVLGINAQEQTDVEPEYKFRITLTDKNGCGFSTDKPEQFLSQKAIERRNRQGLSITETDLPVNAEYVNRICSMGVKFVHSSKWNNTLVVQAKDSAVMSEIRTLPFVKATRLVASVKPAKAPEGDRTKKIEKSTETPNDGDIYGKGCNQINQLHGAELHALGYRGQGMTIAIIDGGFNNADIIPALRNTRIVGSRDFAYNGIDLFADNSHGMKVLSCMGTNVKGVFTGTAPEADYWLIRSEDTHSEQLVEEDNWVAAVEFADSVGVDVINSSLGYHDFDNNIDNVKYRELDGETHLISHTASMIASKGMILVTSAGNEGNKTWKKISVPADAKDILAVGAVDVFGVNTLFSSLGNTEDGRIKPDVCAMGGAATVLEVNGNVVMGNGTSFASPILAGMVACLWQALPNMNAYDIMDIVRKSGNYADYPNNVYGFGIPNFVKALKSGKQQEL